MLHGIMKASELNMLLSISLYINISQVYDLSMHEDLNIT